MSLLISRSVRERLTQVVWPALTTTSVRGYKKDLTKPKCVFGDIEKKLPIYFSFDEGKRESDPDAIRRFYRLHWGGWIRTKAARRKKLWYKKGEEHWWMRQHLFCSDDQALMMERMITPEYKKERHFVDDIYAPYHKRHGFDSLPRGKKKVTTNYFDLMYQY